MGGPKTIRGGVSNRVSSPARADHSSLLAELMAEDSLAGLRTLLRRSDDESTLRSTLLSLFYTRARYTNVQSWNEAVRLCEALAIIGWGDNEALQAVRGKFFNGYPMTAFVNRKRERRFVDATWSIRKAGLTMEARQASYYPSPDFPAPKSLESDYPVREDIQDGKLAQQRNWIEQNPILIRRGISNCYESTRALADSIDQKLMPLLDAEMCPAIYGSAIRRIHLRPSFSYFDNPSCKCNYILFDEPKKLGRAALRAKLAEMYSPEEISAQGYFARNRFDIGPFSQERGTMRVDIHFGKELANMPGEKQWAYFADSTVEALDRVVQRLKVKKLGGAASPYKLDTMQEDFRTIVASWARP